MLNGTETIFINDAEIKDMILLTMKFCYYLQISCFRETLAKKVKSVIGRYIVSLASWLNRKYP